MSYSSDSDQTEELLQRLAAGHSTALACLLELHRPFLKQLVSLHIEPEMTARVDPSDIVQETYVVIAKRIRAFLDTRPTSFRIWLRRTAMERLIDQRRRHVSTAKRSVYRETKLPNSSIAIARKLFTDTPSKILRKNELLQQVRDQIDGLGDNDREILALRHAEGLSNAEVADLLEIDPNSVRQRYGRALRRLHQRLAAHDITMDDFWE